MKVVSRCSLDWVGNALRGPDEPVENVWNLEVKGSDERGRLKAVYKRIMRKRGSKKLQIEMPYWY